MKIEKVLNNNAVVAMNAEQQEVIIIGRGIAYQKRAGDMVSEQHIDKIFTLQNEDIQENFKALISSIPLEYMKVSEEIIAYAKLKLGKKLNESIYLHLTDHIHFAIERYRKNLPIRNGLIWETKQLYKEEYEVGMEALNMICDQFGVILPEDEAGFMALHFVNAALNEEMPNIKSMTQVMQEILTIIKYHFKIDFDENSLTFYRFVTHLKFFAQRLVKGKHYKSNNDDELFLMIQKKYPAAHKCSEKIKKFIESNYTYQLTDEELMYLTIHIERVVNATTE
ncbi:MULTISPECIES: BglG family transcription antiterminator LicT [unclassified Paenibacillus]|uniref:BglG family transcription antiterminator LicT n=1 Tax=unclassified Paenibacillus TaxID=185978 RepID=UPI000CFB1A6B|nr:MULTISPECIES: PRD domain-containing protein [unclassified Paenibacillus]MBD8836572.1 PRD domain-containing protein [Paenibacillus sp. CFBP 13594]PRA04941.1 transcription antiterminator LicT [Paenibacillus sp. MYb63]PRA47714.1 transcription antiterminator LicT [Paenibacillus sp. MYb67]QZN74819.1 PRD domain-containing protein [Paenibacillus sp. DR312]